MCADYPRHPRSLLLILRWLAVQLHGATHVNITLDLTRAIVLG